MHVVCGLDQRNSEPGAWGGGEGRWHRGVGTQELALM